MIARGPSDIIETVYKARRDVAQSGSALGWGPSGRRFKSGRPDPSRRDLTERPGSFGHTPAGVERHRVLRPHSGLLLRRVRPARLPVEPRRGRLRREAPPAIEV